MSQVVTSIGSLNAQRDLSTPQGASATALQRRPPGPRISALKGDANGQAIPERLTPICGLDQARRDANEGISLSQTAEGALSRIAKILQRVRALAVQSANATRSATEREALNDEVSRLIQECDRIAATTMFNGRKILDGSYQGRRFQVGVNVDETIDVCITGASAADLKNNSITLESGTGHDGLGTVTVAAAGAAACNRVGAQTLTIASRAGSMTVGVAPNDQAGTIAASIEAVVAATGVSAKATTSATIASLSADGTVSFSIKGGGTAAAISAKVATTDLTALATAINDVAGKTRVTAILSADKASITVEQADGKDIVIQGFANSAGGTVTLCGSAAASAPRPLASDGRGSACMAGSVRLNSDLGFTVVTSAGTGVLASATAATASTVAKLDSVDISTLTDAHRAIDIIDAELAQINRMRVSLGAIQNHFQNAIANPQTTSETLSDSRIRDADFAAETAALTRAQILQRTGTAVLAQANAIPDNVLTLLR